MTRDDLTVVSLGLALGIIAQVDGWPIWLVLVVTIICGYILGVYSTGGDGDGRDS